MKKLPFILFIFIFLVNPVFTQNEKPVVPVFETPRKPAKPPETAEEFFEAARWEHWKSRNIDEAVKLLDRAIILKPDYADAYYMRGNLKSYMKDCKGAIADYDVVIQLYPDALNTYQSRAECRIALKDLSGAMADFDASVNGFAAKQQIQYNAFFKRAQLKYLLKDYDGAIIDFTTALRANDSQEGRLFRAFAFMKKSDTDAAVRDLNVLTDFYFKVTEEVREKYPEQYTEKKDYPPGENPLATLDKKNQIKGNGNGIGVGVGIGDGDSPTINCDKCPKTVFAEFEDKIIPDNWFFPQKKTYLGISFIFDDAEVVFYYLGDLLERKGDTKGAIEAFTNSLIAKAYDQRLIYTRRGKLFLQTNQFEPAVRDFSWAIFEKRASPDAYLERGIAILMLGHDALAQKDFDNYLKYSSLPNTKEIINQRVATAKKLRDLLKVQQENANRQK